MTLAVVYQESNIQDRDIKPDQSVMVSLALKYLGSYQFQTDASGLLGPDASDLSAN